MHSLGLALALAFVQDPSGAPPATFPELGLTVTAPAMEGLKQNIGAPTDPVRASWTGKLGASDVFIGLYTFPIEKWGFREAGGVTVEMLDWLREKGDFDVDESFEHEGKYGTSPVLSVVTGRTRDGGKVVGMEYAASGLTSAHGYSLHVRIRPEPSEGDKLSILRFLETGIAYDGPLRDPQWTEEEVLARWKKDAPDELFEEFERNLSKKAWVKNALLRTEHYIVLTNASGGKKFAEQMEANYDQIGKLFPLPAAKGCRLLPVFLFRTADEYYAFYVKRGETLEKAKRSAGHASGDYYATWYNSPTDPTHIHEQTHQLFRNRLFLNGGGSWYQEGMAEYVETSKNARNVVASQVAKGRHLALVELVKKQSLLFSSSESRKEGGSEASDLYTQAALLVEFLRESKWGKDKFPRFLEVVGRVPRGNLPKIQAAFQEVYGMDVEAVDKAFQAYCAKR
jgi:hypothetical protein